MEECVGKIQPGALLGSGCTANWIVRDENAALYVGTAGHCVSGVGAEESVAGVGRIGIVVFAVSGALGSDYALIAIDPAVYDRVSPTLCRWGGPTGVSSFEARPDALPSWIGGGVIASTTPVLHYGWGAWAGLHAASRARVMAAADATATSVTLVGNANPGDSGSPIMFADGLVAGFVTHSLVVGPPCCLAGVGAGLAYGTRFDRALALAEAGTGLTLTLVASDEPPLGV